ncbi:MAG TPA: hypothetical protein VFG14_04165 [Chthoniobacteraceae bacterium]|nr:hypothetical protein [Chthoniobacteraceae bacterium]
MCCFTRPVKRVSNTNIFVRPVGSNDQVVVYSMRLSANEELAMVLPIPTDPRKGVKAVNFIDLSKYPMFFNALRNGFPPEGDRTAGLGDTGGAFAAAPKPIEVVTVGSFDASFVPSPNDFNRLDERFRLPDGTWEKLGGYENYGFVVFKLRSGNAQVHPMAFQFASARPELLFFPTVHVHDGKVHERATFDHDLYCQVSRGGVRSLASWQESQLPASRFINASETKGVILADRHVFRRRIEGIRANKDLGVTIA